jgi:hypothetical protein
VTKSKDSLKLSLKACIRCGLIKERTDFGPNKENRDRLQTKCKPCLAELARISRQKNPARGEYNRKYYRDNKERYDALRTTELYLEKKRKTQFSAYWKDKTKFLARRRVRIAIENGSLIRPDKCERCYLPGKIHGHHEDYSKPLEVMWLCEPCHIGRHMELRKSS